MKTRMNISNCGVNSLSHKNTPTVDHICKKDQQFQGYNNGSYKKKTKKWAVFSVTV